MPKNLMFWKTLSLKMFIQVEGGRIIIKVSISIKSLKKHLNKNNHLHCDMLLGMICFRFYKESKF